MRQRSGMSLVELVVALGLFSILLAATLGFYRQQGKAFSHGNDRSTVMQNLRYAMNNLEQNLRAAGTGVPFQQPVIVYAGEDVLAFNANYASNVEGDFFAVYSDPRYPPEAVSALTEARRITVPNTTFSYPETSYFAGSGNSPAETIIYFFAPDTTTAREDDYVLYRQVNDLEPDVVARGLLRADRPFFTYYALDEDASGGPMVEVPAQYLPAAHTEPIHGSPADTGLVAAVDSARAVRVTFAGTNDRSGSRESIREVSQLIRMPNLGVGMTRDCGSRPILGRTLTGTTMEPSGSTAGHIRLDWNPAVDELSGNMDVIRYVIWRRESETDPWGDPLASVAAGAESYVYRDYSAQLDTQYWYALAAQDCTPRFSDLALFGPSSVVPDEPSWSW